MSESSVAAGVRRIEAVTGGGVLQLLNDYHSIMAQAADAMKIGNVEDIGRRAAQLTAELKAVQKELEAAKAKLASQKIEGLFSDAKVVAGIKVIAAAFTGHRRRRGAGHVRPVPGTSPGDIVVVLAGIQEDAGSVSFACYCAPGAVKMGPTRATSCARWPKSAAARAADGPTWLWRAARI